MRYVRLLVLTFLAGLLAGCSGGDAGSFAQDYQIGGTQSTVRLAVGSKDFTEQEILGEITVQALNAAGAETVDMTGTGDTETLRRALLTEEIDLYWEYTGTGWLVHLAEPNPIADPEEQYEAVASADRQRNGVEWLPFAPADNTYAIATRSGAFEEVQTISDLETLVSDDPDGVTVCVGPEFNERSDGLPGLEDHYGFEFPDSKVSVLSDSTVYGALGRGERCDFGSVFETDGRIPELGLRLLEDDEEFFAAYNPSLNVRSETLELYPDLEPLAADLASSLDTEALRQLSASVEVEGITPNEAAEEWLRENGYVS